MSFFAELKRRNVIRVGIAYLVAGWLVTEVASVVLPTFGAPEWVLQVLITMLVIGFPMVLAFSWIYELTPEGLKKESEIAPGESITAHTARKLDLVVIVLLIITGTLVVADRLLPDPKVNLETPVEIADDSPGSLAPGGTDRPAEPSTASVAVLAFENMSPDPDNAYFAEGISEEILNILAGIEGLQVASRTSAFSFAGRDTPIPEIARQLDVANVLEGSVRRQGNRVRITAQLIDAGTDKHLWSDTFDRDLDDIFAVQEEIGRAIAKALGAALGVNPVAVTASTRNLAAYELFLRGRQLFYRRGGGPDVFYRALDDLRAAVGMDPEFDEAWAFLSATAYTSTSGYLQLEPNEQDALLAEARSAAERALALDPEQALATAVLGHLAENPLESLALLDRAASMAPEDAGLQMWAGFERFHLGGYLDQALPLLERAYRLDPLVGINNGALGLAYLADGQYELGRRHILRASELGWNAALPSLLQVTVTRGEIDDALAVARAIYPLDETSWSDDERNAWAHDERIIRAGIRSPQTAQSPPRIDDIPSGRVGGVYAFLWLGDLDRLFDELFANLDNATLRNVYFARWFYVPGGKPAVEDLRFLTLGEQLGLIPAWEELGYPMGCQRVHDATGGHLQCDEWPE